MEIGDKVKVDNPRNINHGVIGEIVDEFDDPYGGGFTFQIVPDNMTIATFWETPDNLVYLEKGKDLSEGQMALWNFRKQTNSGIKCECGSDTAKLGTHMDYCPKYNLINVLNTEDDDPLPF